MNTMLPYAEARRKVIEVAGALRRPPRRETIEIEQSFGRVLAEPVLADRDYPPFNRSTRDGFAVRAADAVVPGARIDCVGELRAGGSFEGRTVRRNHDGRERSCRSGRRGDDRTHEARWTQHNVRSCSAKRRSYCSTRQRGARRYVACGGKRALRLCGNGPRGAGGH